jgi:hypothetical protein
LAKRTLHTVLILLFIFLAVSPSYAQYKIKGTVYDSSRTIPIEGVTVLATNGNLVNTDTLGRYTLEVGERDSVWFSFMGKPTPKYPVLKITDVNHFDLALKLKMDVMKEVVIRTRSYINDSLENRRNYQKIFDYHRPGFETMTSVGAMGAGIDVNELIRLFQFRKNKSMLKFQERLLQEERDKFIDKRFNQFMVRNLTGLDGNDLKEFMEKYRPTFEFTALSSDYDFRYFIKLAAEQYKRSKNI